MIDGVPFFRVIGMFLFAAALVLLAVIFDDWPVYQQIPDDTAVIKLSFSHGSDRSSECRRLTQEELEALPFNKRVPIKCPRRRHPVVAELTVNDDKLFAEAVQPTGLSGDGPSQIYRRFTVPAGPTTIIAKLRDTPREDGFDYEKTVTIDLQPGQNFAIDFHPDTGGFKMQ